MAERAQRLGIILLIGAVVLPGLILAANGFVAWRQAWGDARAAVGRTADSAAEYALRVLEGHKLRLDRVNDMLRGMSDDDIRARRSELSEKLSDFTRTEGEGALAISVFDRDGHLLVASSNPPEPSLDRDFSETLRQAERPAIAVSPLYIAHPSNRRYFALSRRRDGTGNPIPAGGYDGVVTVSVYLAAANEALARQSDADSDVVALLRSDGYFLARSVGIGDAAVPARIRQTGPISAALARGDDRLMAEGSASLDGTRRVFALRRVAGWPVYTLAARPLESIVGVWQRSMGSQLLIGVPCWLALIALAWLVRRSHADLERRVAERTAGLAAAASALREGEHRLRLAHEAAGIGYWDHDISTGATEWSPEMYALYGLDPEHDGPMSHGRYFNEIIYPDDRERVTEAAREALATGRYECEYRIWRRRPDGGREPRWIVGRGRVVVARDGTNRRLLGANVDITERREAEEQEAMLMREVDHRAKNVLAVVLSLIRLTRREGGVDYAASVEGRVAAMGRVHTLLAENRWAGAHLKEIVDAELGVYAVPRPGRDARVQAFGPPVRLAPQTAQAMSVVLHELATNAVKYGALSVPDGRVAIDWRVDDGDTLILHWRESGGPPVSAPPQRRGFGQRLLENTVRRQLGGELILEWAPEGLRCTVTAPEVTRPPVPVASAAD
jgi:PAS domain S-box-containing protein